ncbi:MAG: MFS transporter [Gammaproteobacteria bacterium]|nr:MFS transporter [Gammaproteobacteria bacterium]MCP4091015.1 MFS transporter [Gammaproteobacteria bacterium]MCP4277459.1 MFS transporter [Gammaproteobacteria bacterium]MCP4831480.1 MFS transporter [Gammaproteobacteria bacterium]MCP4927703.1 MFS transporter [Gammaproteobacteria bacterium]
MNTSLPSRSYAWYTVFLLTLIYIFSFIDRYILSLLIEPIKNDLELTDTQVSLLLGPAFALFYTTLGVPLGWLSDRARRTWIIGVGVTVWSLATAASGIAVNFVQLFIARITVGVGEATLSPCALPIIADSFPPEKRGKPIAVYAAALSIGAGIAYITGASVIIWSKTVDAITLPILGLVAPWQFAFIVVGLPGLLVALLCLALREPARQERAGLTDEKNAGLRDATRYLWANKHAYAGFVLIVSVMLIISYSQFWLPAMFQRTWGWEGEKFGLYYGIGMLLIGPLTVNITGWLSDRMTSQGQKDAPVKLIILGTLLMVPTASIAPLMPSAELAFGVFMLNLISLAMISAVAPTALMNITPGEIRGQVTAIYFLIISVAGLFLGPMTVGLLNDNVMGENGLQYSVALVPVIYGIPALFLIRWALRGYRKKLLTNTA